MIKLWEDHAQLCGGLDCFGTCGPTCWKVSKLKNALPVPLPRQVFCEVIWTAQAWSKSLFCEN